MPAFLTPSRFISLCVGLMLLLNLACLLTAMSLPSLPGVWQLVDEQLIYLKDGQPYPIAGIAAEQGDWMALEASDRVEEPDFLTTFDAYNRLFQRQNQLMERLSGPDVRLLTLSGETLTEPVGQRHWSELPGPFWVQLVVADVAFVIAMLVWVFRRGEAPVVQYAVMGVALLVVILPAAIYSTRPLAMDGELFHALSVIDHFGLFLFGAAILSLMWLFPQPLSRFPMARLAYVVMMLVWLLNTLQWVPDFNWTVRLVPLSLVLLTSLFIVLHWRRTDDDPANRIAVIWFLLTMSVGASSFVMVIFLPPMLGYEPLMSQSLAFTLFLSIYISLAVGVARYRLFDLGRWWFEGGLWLLSGALIVLFDLAILALLDVTYQQATWIALALTGWLYFPVRQLLIQHIFRKYRLSLDATLPHLVSALTGVTSNEEIISNIQSCFQQTFLPLEKRVVSDRIAAIQIGEEGHQLRIPLPRDYGTLELFYADAGKRLFNSADVGITRSMMRLFDHALAASEARQEGMQLERTRIRQDMHDSLGGYLLAIIQQAPDQKIRQLGRYAWSELRDILSSLDARSSSLSENIGHWRSQLGRLVSEQGVELRFRIDEALYQAEWPLNGLQRLNIGQMLREGLVNALRHSTARQIDIALGRDGDDLTMSLTHAGVSRPVSDWSFGRGRHHLQQRAQQLGGVSEWQQIDRDVVALMIRIPLGGLSS